MIRRVVLGVLLLGMVSVPLTSSAAAQQATASPQAAVPVPCTVQPVGHIHFSEIAEHLKDRERLEGAIVKGLISDEGAAKQKVEIDTALAKAEAGLAEAQRVKNTEGVDQIAAFTTVRDEWPAMTAEEQNRALKGVLAKVIIRPTVKGQPATAHPLKIWE